MDKILRRSYILFIFLLYALHCEGQRWTAILPLSAFY